MSRTVFRSESQVEAWLSRQTKPVKWCFAPETGRTSLQSWESFSSVGELPRGRKLLMRVDDSKGGVHVLLPADSGTTAGLAVSVPERAALLQRARDLDLKERDLRDFESDLLAQQRKVQAEQAAIALRLDERLATQERRLSDLDRERREQVQEVRELLDELRAQIERADKAESSGAVAASLAYGVDKLLDSITLWRAKGFDGVPAKLIEDFKQFQDQRASRRLLEYLPDSVRKLVGSFLDLKESQRQQFLFEITQAMKREAAERKGAAPSAGPASAPQPEGPAAPPARPTRARRKSSKLRSNLRPRPG